MRNKGKITTELELVGTLKMLAEAYEEVSVLKMQKVRGSVLATREFLDGLGGIFVDVKKNYGQKIERMIDRKKMAPHATFSTRSHNGKTLIVFLSANSKFYGDIVRRVFEVFLADVKKKDADILIIGKSGKEMMDQSGFKKEYNYLELGDTQVGLEDLRPIIEKLVEYEKVDVYYGRFSNMVNQLPTIANVSGQGILESQAEVKVEEVKETVTPYAFEPSVEKILDFFESQVFISLFKQTVNESELARLASRIRAMEEALGNIERLEPKIKREGRIMNKAMQNKKQIEVMTSVYFLRNQI
jgi:ATP synthase F1 gamma subunit